MATSSSVWAWSSMPSEQAMLIGLPSARMASMPSRTWRISRSSGSADRGHDAELGGAGLGGLAGGPDQLIDVQPHAAYG